MLCFKFVLWNAIFTLNATEKNNIFLTDPLEQFEIQHSFWSFGHNNLMDGQVMPHKTMDPEKIDFVDEPEFLKIFAYVMIDWSDIFSFAETAVGAFLGETMGDYMRFGFISPAQIIIIWIFCAAICISVLIFGEMRKMANSLSFINYTENPSVVQKGFFIRFLNTALLNIVKVILKSNVSLKKNEYFSVLYFLFFFILICNMFGLIPFTFTITSSFAVTFFLAATHFIGINIIFIYRSGKDFYKIFLPSGIPSFITPFLFVIEIISYVAKVFSLSIRLFANMMSGHALLKILIGFSWTMLSVSGGIFYGVAIFPWIIVTLILFLEILIAFLQAYVFVVLVAIYINDILNSH